MSLVIAHEGRGGGGGGRTHGVLPRNAPTDAYDAIGGIAPNRVIARSEFEVYREILRSECNEGCDWCIYVTVVTCADTLTSTLCIQ